MNAAEVIAGLKKDVSKVGLTESYLCMWAVCDRYLTHTAQITELVPRAALAEYVHRNGILSVFELSLGFVRDTLEDRNICDLEHFFNLASDCLRLTVEVPGGPERVRDVLAIMCVWLLKYGRDLPPSVIGTPFDPVSIGEEFCDVMRESLKEGEPGSHERGDDGKARRR